MSDNSHLQLDSIHDVEASEYLEENVFPALTKGLETLLETLKKSDGNFDLSPDSMLHPIPWLGLYLHQESRKTRNVKTVNLETLKN